MKRQTVIATICGGAALIAALSVAGFASARPAGAGKATPGHMMQDRGPVPGHPGASGYAPGHQHKSKPRRHRGEVRVIPNVISYYR